MCGKAAKRSPFVKADKQDKNIKPKIGTRSNTKVFLLDYPLRATAESRSLRPRHGDVIGYLRHVTHLETP